MTLGEIVAWLRESDRTPQELNHIAGVALAQFNRRLLELLQKPPEELVGMFERGEVEPVFERRSPRLAHGGCTDVRAALLIDEQDRTWSSTDLGKTWRLGVQAGVYVSSVARGTAPIKHTKFSDWLARKGGASKLLDELPQVDVDPKEVLEETRGDDWQENLDQGLTGAVHATGAKAWHETIADGLEARAEVVARHPHAEARHIPDDWPGWFVVPNLRQIGAGTTEAGAWQNALEELRKPPEPRPIGDIVTEQVAEMVDKWKGEE